MSEPREEPSEQEILETLTMLAEFSRVYWRMLQTAGPVIERLSRDDSLAALLLTTLATAIAPRPALGTPRHVEQLAREILKTCPATDRSACGRSEWC